ncbi:MAG: bile acid:sodium symporter family protein [Fimbriimonadaceae bacterium]|jgi:BASS family bile acid:Na+ symporter|nr:bile acid:sodium symporter family protein [Fimbriimonadaceae bacterium]
MQTGVLTEVFLPLALALVMLGLGLSLTVQDFQRALQLPKATIAGLVGQLLILPLLGFAVVAALGLPPFLAAGLLILAFCPGGPTSNIITHLAKGDTALSVTLTAVGSLVTAITTPILATLAVQNLARLDATVTLPFAPTLLQILLLTVVPVGIGLTLRSRFPEVAKKSERSATVFSLVILALIILGAIIRERENLPSYFTQVGFAALTLNLLALLAGFTIAKALRLHSKQGLTIGIEMGIQNGTMALVITSKFASHPEMTIGPAIYSILMFVTGGIVIAFSPLRRVTPSHETPA